jgi:hypothetical protein
MSESMPNASPNLNRPRSPRHPSKTRNKTAILTLLGVLLYPLFLQLYWFKIVSGPGGLGCWNYARLATYAEPIIILANIVLLRRLIIKRRPWTIIFAILSCLAASASIIVLTFIMDSWKGFFDTYEHFEFAMVALGSLVILGGGFIILILHSKLDNLERMIIWGSLIVFVPAVMVGVIPIAALGISISVLRRAKAGLGWALAAVIISTIFLLWFFLEAGFFFLVAGYHP